MRNLAPYIGITDFRSFEQVQAMLEVFKKHKHPKSPRQLHVGAMMSYKTLHGLPTKWTAAFPKANEYAGIFASPETFNCLHFADYEDGRPDIAASLEEAIALCGPHLHAIQLDMVWPDPTQIGKGYYQGCQRLGLDPRQVDIILQINRVAIERMKSTSPFVTDLDLLINNIRHYEDRIHRVLVDKSMGQGIGMNATELLPIVDAIDESGYALVGVAGGLGPETMNLVEPIVAQFPFVSIDAQGRLRPSGKALDPIDWEMAKQYLIRALEMFGEN